jgi:uncharacterized membrane protein
VHGGGFYNMVKYLVAPARMPDDLTWFKWEAYATWISGFALVVAIFYASANLYLIDPAVMALSPTAGIAISVAALVLGWAVYDGLCRSPLGRNDTVLAAVGFVFIVALAYAFTKVFSARGAFMQIGAVIGTIMAANVLMVIIPGQRKVVADLIAGRAPDPVHGRRGKQRSTHNNYLTLPVLVMMVSPHYPFLSAHPHAWLVVALIIIAGALIRHYINRVDAGDEWDAFGWSAPVAAFALICAIWLTAPRAPASTGGAVSDAEVLAITAKHCTMCHAAKPTHESFKEAPKNVMLESVADLRKYAPLVLSQTVQNKAMPLGNQSGMTEEERGKIGAWIAAQH